MKKMEKKKKYFLLAIIIFVIILVMGSVILTLNKKKEDQQPNEEESGLTVDTANSLYSQMTDACSGAILWDVTLNTEVTASIEDYESHCQKENYSSKLFGFTEDEDGARLDIKVVKTADGKVYDLENNLLGDYTEETMDAIMDNGTTYSYFYKKNNDQYQLVKVKAFKVEKFE